MAEYTTHRFNVTEYYRLAEIGVLAPDARVELLNGQVLDCFPSSPLHAAVKRRLSQRFFDYLPEKACTVSISGPVHLDEYSEVQPDVMLIKYREDYYCSKHPGPEDIYLLIEIADISLDFDRTEKLSAYARAGINEFWIVNLNEATIEVYREPNFTGYGSKTILRADDKIAVRKFPNAFMKITELLEH
jgi:Uma2 family endonuclease